MASSRILKDPQEVRPISINWAGSLPKADAIIDSAWEAEPVGELTLDNPVKGQLQTVAMAAGGVSGTTYVATNRITSQLGLTLEKSVSIRVQNRVG